MNSLVASLLFGVFLGQPVQDTPVKDDVNVLVEGVQKRYEEVTDFKARFTQTVTRKHLPRPRVNKGKVFFKRPGMMRWDYISPEKVYYISDGDILWSYQPEDKLAYRMKVKESGLYQALKFLFGQGDLLKDFNVKAGDRKDGLAQLILHPKIVQSNYKLIRLFVDVKTYDIKTTELVDPLDNVSRVTFGKVSYEELNAKAFSFKPPAGVRVEDLARTTQPTSPKP
jgi:outer membrane lipoprotein carrier protein